ncbi:hypothetical protein H6G93_09220 [Nostoc sp. FACHB-973]|nr:hypothetical protein [Nostoc sp. FACHB-973]
MEQIFSLLKQAEKASQLALDSSGKIGYPCLGVVTNVKDPEGKRRIKVANGVSPVDSDWLRRLSHSPQVDAQLPEVGQTVLIFYADGLETNGYYLQIVNDTNPPRAKESAPDDHSEAIRGSRDATVGGDDDLGVDGKISVDAGESITINAGTSIRFQTTSGAFLELGATGFVTLSDAYGHVWTLGGSSGSTWTWNANGAAINVINANDFTINSKSIATLTAQDSRGDHLVTRGWS